MTSAAIMPRQSKPTQNPTLSQCWICGSMHKLSREHFPKKADTRRYMKSGRLFRHTSKARNEHVQSAASKRLYLGAPICAACNNARTQPHDRAWDTLRDYMLDNWPAIVAAGELDLKAVYGADWPTRAIDLQLYFVKVLGCVTVLEQIPIPVQPLRDALMNGAAYPHLFLMLCDSQPATSQAPRAMLSASDMQVAIDRLTGEVAAASWGYALQPVGVWMVFATPSYPIRPLPAAWHPLAAASIMRLGPPVIAAGVPALT